MPKSEEEKRKAPPVENDSKAVWIWTLSLLDEHYATNQCLLKALRLAESIAKSKKGQQAFSRVNKPGVKFTKEEVDKTGLHPEIVIENRTDSIADAVVAEYKGDKGYPHRKDRIHFNKKHVDRILKRCEQGQEEDSVIFLASTLLHETAHWKDDVIKHSDGYGDTPGEEGEHLEDDIFGGDLDLDKDGNLILNGKKVNDSTKAKWNSPDNWKP